MAKRLFVSIKEEFSTAARSGDFSSPDLMEVKRLLDERGLALSPVTKSGGTHRLTRVFLVNGEKAHDPALVTALQANAAVAYVEKPIPHFSV